ncbi:UNVERIFIED_CONTAM: RIMS-binding protein 2 [Gekko kuhli]
MYAHVQYRKKVVSPWGTDSLREQQRTRRNGQDTDLGSIPEQTGTLLRKIKFLTMKLSGTFWGCISRTQTGHCRANFCVTEPSLVSGVAIADGYSSRDRLSPEIYEESETDPGAEDVSPRIFVALFDYDPLTMSPNPDAAEEELPFKEGQIIKVYGDKDADGFYRGETCARLGLIPCNMVSEIQADDEEMMDQLLKQGFLPLNTPVEKLEMVIDELGPPVRLLANGPQLIEKPAPLACLKVTLIAFPPFDRNRKEPEEQPPTCRINKENGGSAELTFCTGDIITVIGEIDEDGFYYGELNGQKGLVPSNFLEEVPDDVEVYLSDAPSRYAPQDTPMRTKAKRMKTLICDQSKLVTPLLNFSFIYHIDSVIAAGKNCDELTVLSKNCNY